MEIYFYFRLFPKAGENKKMRTSLKFQWLSSVIFLYLVNQAHGQKRGIPHDLKCITHNLKVWNCSWEAISRINHGTTYEICILNSSFSCIQTEKTHFEIPALSLVDHEIKITSMHVSGNSVTKFILNERSVSLVPATLQNFNLTADFSTSTLYLKWNDNGSAFPYHSNVIWEIIVLYKEDMEVATVALYNTTLNGKDSVHHWNWTSDIPLECILHYVKIRYYIDEFNFFGQREWSEWSPLKNISGPPIKENYKAFPEDRVVPVGSNMTFCCVVQEPVLTANFGNEKCPFFYIDNKSVAIQINNITVSPSGGTNVVFTTKSSVCGTVIFAGYPPDIPRKLNCETRDLKEIICSWNPGRPTGLVGPRDTNYILYERFSGRNVKYIRDEEQMNENHQLIFQMIAGQEIYNFTLKANNPVGRSEAVILVNVTQRVYPHTPSKLIVRDINSTIIMLYWHLPGNFANINLLCEIEINTTYSGKELRKIIVKGLETPSYYVSVDKLMPYTMYTFRVRCSSTNFWKWSKWSNEKQYLTMEEIPSKGLDIWREWSADGKSIIIYWKPLSIIEANGKILYYNVSYWSEEEPQYHSEIPDSQHKAIIKLDRNDYIDYIISVVAKNSVGSSPPSKITTMEIPNEDLKVEQIVGIENGILFHWNYDPNMTCDYVIKWCNSTQSEPCLIDWKKFPANSTGALIEYDHFQSGTRYKFFLYGCKNQKYQLLRSIVGYTKELAPSIAPNFTVEDTSADSILVKWEDIPVDDLRGFLRGYLFYFEKGEKGTSKIQGLESGRPDVKVKNITDITQKTLRIVDLQGKTGYHLLLQAYTDGGVGPGKAMYVVTKENSEGLIIAILIPVAVAIFIGVVTSILCYRKREWIKETFYPDIPNPENSKALQFHKSICEGNSTLKTLEMNPCTPNNVEVVETRLAAPKIEEDTEIKSPVADGLEEGSDAEPENHVVVSYCPPIIEEEIASGVGEEAGGSSQVIYIDIQSMYQPQAKPEEELEQDSIGGAGYKPQMHLPVTSTVENISAAEDLEKTSGYRPQTNVNAWNLDSPDSPRSIDSNSEMVSFGSPCSINSRQFLIPPKDEESPKSSNGGWSFTNFFQNKPND
ncbi:leukemia inhibitory factor receptor [Macrotis lagotis]|uniref:leukemia inhibitory factor receptor n=1 Tax=Macrotis lagotis TaxID=92651 RepID=UPI003D69A8C2